MMQSMRPEDPAGPARRSPARLAPEVAALFPAGVVAAELRGEGEPAWLTPAERALTQGFAPRRIKEFAAGRLCARRALEGLGIEGFSLLRAQDRQPVWPAAITGSITHTQGYCVAVSARQREVRGLGIDSEVIVHVREELWPRICGAGEQAWLEREPCEERMAHAALVFAAKEAFYKCQYPLTGQWLDFMAVQIELADAGAAGGEFLVRPQQPLALEAAARFPLKGQFRLHEGWVTAGIALP